MANIGRLPNAAELLEGAARTGSYGERLFFEVEGLEVTLITDKRVSLARATGQRIRVDLANLDPLAVPYVNAFVAHSGKRVEKYWRTKQYRIVDTGQAEQPAADLEAAPQADLLAMLGGAATPSERANRLRQIAILIREAADEIDRQAIQVTGVDERVEEVAAPSSHA